jgi:hypothetical protein
MPEPGSLEQRLLHDPIPDDDAPGRRWAYSLGGSVLLSVFIAYHLLAVLVQSAPGRETRAFRDAVNRYAETEHYLGAAGITWSWAVFAPDPPQRNVFTRVVVVDAGGQEWDLGHDIMGRRAYPYLVYDRLAKVNRQMLRQKEYLVIYAGWVCRDWERGHRGEAPQVVRLLPVTTTIPRPDQAYLAMGYSPRGLDVKESSPEVYECGTIMQGRLPSALRARAGLPPLPPGVFRDVPRRSWASGSAQDGGGRAEPTAPALE